MTRTIRLALLGIAITLAGCADRVRLERVHHISGTVAERVTGKPGPTIGIVADSQLQTRTNYERVPVYRGKWEDWWVAVSMRPPALDWAARSMLRTDLERLKADGAEAIFFLGDGANNGCYDEFSAGFEGTPAKPDEEGVLALLDRFRQDAQIPVYFVIGNHDLLGAGSTSNTDRRRKFCSDAAGVNHPLLKSEVIAITDRFNRANDRFAPAWRYTSNLDAADTAVAGTPTIRQRCGGKPERQHRTWGCYLAAKVEYRGAGPRTQFLLLDSNDWVNVSQSSLFGIDQEGLRGAMSFGDPRGDIPSQTAWFQQHAASDDGQPIDVRIALTHYDLPGLRKKVPFIGKPSRKSQRVMDLFTSPRKGSLRTANQASAFVVSAHTHSYDYRNSPVTFRVDCTGWRCKGGELISVGELNVGSTTDDSNYATLIQLVSDITKPASIVYQRVTPETTCHDVYQAIRDYRFARPFMGNSTGWLAIGVNPDDRHNYRDFSFPDMPPLWENLKEFAGTDRHRANCIGLRAAQLEGNHPLTW